MPDAPKVLDPADPNTLKEISFGKKELDPEEEQRYLEKIKDAKARGLPKGRTPVGGVERPQIPLLQRPTGPTQSGMTPAGGVQARPSGSPAVRPETQQQIEDFAKASAAQKEKEVQAAMEKEEEKKVEEKKESLADLFNFDQMSEAERILNNKKRREEIESRCLPMDFEDLLLKDEVKQRVPIIPGKFEPMYRSTTPEENLFIRRFMAEEKSPSDAYTLEWYAMCQLACSIVDINGDLLPDHRDKDGTPDSKLFSVKLTRMLKKSGYIIADLGVNYTWFDLRVRRLIAPEKVGNG